MRILCIAAPSKDGSSKLYKIDKDLEELKTLSSKHPLSWIVKGIESKLAPNFEELRSCSFHSNLDSSIPRNDVEACFKYASQCPNTKYAIYDENYICYDLCEYQSQINEKMKYDKYQKYSKILENLRNYYINNMSNFSYFYKVYKERENLFSEKKKLENPINLRYIKDPKYNSLNQTLITCEVRYIEACESKEKVYNANKFIKEKYSLEDYITQETKTEKDKLEESKSAVNGWLARNNFAEASKYTSENLEDLIDKINKRLQDNYRKSYIDILLLRRDLQGILHFCNTSKVHYNSVQQVQCYIDSCNENIKLFKDFKDDSDDEAVLYIHDYYDKIDKKKLEDTEKEEKLRKEKITKVSVASNSVIVKADGTVVTDDSSGPKIVVGKVIESKADIEAEKQARLDRNTTWL
jgi:hypothetical protein